uniref:Uncharacterized protein n=1 Tax=Knipowitschia caucasica TaxID=637954 RepID=A0AAV2KQX7_KNICA
MVCSYRKNQLKGTGLELELDQDSEPLQPVVHVKVGTKVLSGLEPYTLIVAVVVLGLVVCVLLWGIWRSSQKREVKRCDHRSLSNQPDDGLTYTAGELLSSFGSTTARLRRDRDAYTKVWYCHCK